MVYRPIYFKLQYTMNAIFCYFHLRRSSYITFGKLAICNNKFIYIQGIQMTIDVHKVIF
jgi:hypothetical protein